MTMLSRVLGFIRDMIIAHLFGAVAGVDAFFVAFKIPNFMRRLFAEGAFSQAFVPVLSEYQKNQSQDEVRQFINVTAGNLGIILGVVTVLAIFAAPLLVTLFAPGFDHGQARFILASDMLRLTFPYLMLISLTAMAGAVLNTYGAFAVPAFTPVFLNLSLIGAAVYLAPHLDEPIKALAWGVLLAGVVQLAFQLPFLHQKGLLPRPQLARDHEGVNRVLKLMLPALFGVSVAQINLMLGTIFASFLQVGSVSWLYYSDRLMSFPLGVFGVALSTVILPQLSRQHATKSNDDFSKTLVWAVRSVLLIGVPAAIGLYLLAGPLLTTLFNYGKFTTHDVMMARLSLMAFSIGVPAFMLIKVLASAFYAQQNIKTPVKIGVIAMLSNIVLNVVFIKPYAHMGIALATSISAIINAGLLFYYLHQRDMFRFSNGWLRFWFQLFLSNAVMAIILISQKGNLQAWLNWHWPTRLEHLASLLILSIISYLATLYVSGFRVSAQ